jgi:predicted Zn-dependent peptidase
MEIKTTTLPNGFRIVHKPAGGTLAHCGLFIHTGTRDERDDEHGMAHFIEHTIFKGTEKRNLFQVLNRLEDVGADLNAFTTKEDTCIHASFLENFYERVIELLHDISFHSVFPSEEIEKEKQVVIDEINSYQDSPAEQVFDDFEDMIFTGDPLGKNILGTTASVKAIRREKIRRFIARNYTPERMVLSSVGNIDFRKLESMARKYFGEEPARKADRNGASPFIYTPSVKYSGKKIGQVHCVTGAPAYSYRDENRVPMALLNNMLGGPILNSRLSLALRERNGLTYHVDSTYTAYEENGIVAIYFGTDPELYEKALTIVNKELKKLREDKLSPRALSIVKTQLKGQLAIASESNLAVMLTMGKSFLVQDRYDPLEEILLKIDAVTSEKLQEIANEVFRPESMSMLTFLPEKRSRKKGKN